MVRAHSEVMARKEVAFKFAIATEVRFAEAVKFNPWWQPEIISCELLEGTDDWPESQPEVLSTSHN